MNLKNQWSEEGIQNQKEWIKKNPAKAGCAGIILVIFLIIFFSIVFSGSSDQDPKTATTGHSDVEVCVEAEHLLEKFLKAPSTAKYPTCNSIKITRVDENTFIVNSYVDSQNSYGAMIRDDWTVAYHYIEDGKMTQLDRVVLGGKTLFNKNSE